MGFVTWVRAQWDRATAVVAVVIGLLAFLLGWIGVSGNSFVSKQLPYVVSGALFGIFMVGIAAVLWLSADLRDEWRELRALRLQDRDRFALVDVTAGTGAGTPVGDSASGSTMELPAVTFDATES